MLSPEQVAMIPSSTRYRWNKFSHDNYDLDESCEEYIQQFDDIKEIFSDYTRLPVKKNSRQVVKQRCCVSETMMKANKNNKGAIYFFSLLPIGENKLSKK